MLALFFCFFFISSFFLPVFFFGLKLGLSVSVGLMAIALIGPVHRLMGGLFPVLPSFTGFYWVFHGLTGFDWVLH